MFVRAKHRGDKALYYLVKSERHGGRVRQKTLAYLGESPTLAEAVAGLRAAITHAEARAAEWRRQAEAARAPVVDEVPTFLYRGSRFNEDHAKQYHSHLREARSFERWARRLGSQLDNLRRFEAAA